MITRLNPANEVQAALLAALKASTALKALVPASRIYPPKTPNTPTRPFVKLGVPIITPRKVDGGDAADVTVAVHCFVSVTSSIPDPRAYSLDVASEIARALDAIDEASLGDGMALAVYVGQIQTVQDEDADSWHSFVNVRCEAT